MYVHHVYITVLTLGLDAHTHMYISTCTIHTNYMYYNYQENIYTLLH